MKVILCRKQFICSFCEDEQRKKHASQLKYSCANIVICKYFKSDEVGTRQYKPRQSGKSDNNDQKLVARARIYLTQKKAAGKLNADQKMFMEEIGSIKYPQLTTQQREKIRTLNDELRKYKSHGD